MNNKLGEPKSIASSIDIASQSALTLWGDFLVHLSLLCVGLVVLLHSESNENIFEKPLGLYEY